MLLCGIQTNPMQNNAYQLVLPRFPKTQFFATDFALPNIRLNAAIVNTPFTSMPFAGDKPMFDPFTFNFIVNEDMGNYQEVFDWINGIGFSESYDSYKNYTNKDSPHQSLGEQDAKVIVLTNKGNALKTIVFHDAIPIALGGMTAFSSQDQDTSYVKASVTMAYTRFTFESL
jgi:hypothetical protein